jgi:hypothetical protein
VPAQAPLHPTKTDSSDATAASVTLAPTGKTAEHSVPQLIPDETLVTEPLPEPVFATVSEKLLNTNVAVTLRASLIATTQVAVPVHAPPQPVNVESFAATAVSVTLVPMV